MRTPRSSFLTNILLEITKLELLLERRLERIGEDTTKYLIYSSNFLESSYRINYSLYN